MTGLEHAWAHTFGPAPWYFWAMRAAVLLGPLPLLREAVRKTRQGRAGYGPVALWAACTWIVFALGRLKFLFAFRSEGYWLGFALQLAVSVLWLVWGFGWVIPFTIREERAWKAEQRRLREAEPTS